MRVLGLLRRLRYTSTPSACGVNKRGPLRPAGWQCWARIVGLPCGSAIEDDLDLSLFPVPAVIPLSVPLFSLPGRPLVCVERVEIIVNNEDDANRPIARWTRDAAMQG